MKKIFLSVLGVFALAVTFSLSTSNGNSVELNSAFANHTCCYESQSMCPKSSDHEHGWQIANHVKKTGSCKGNNSFELAFE